METFEEWWIRVARGYDPDVEEVSWYDKRKFLAEQAFIAAKAQSRNYTADEEVMPEKVTFANGRVVSIADNPSPNVHHGVYLEVGQLPEQFVLDFAAPLGAAGEWVAEPRRVGLEI